MISIQQQKYINMCLELAAKSSYRFRLGAVITEGGRVRGIGYSKYQNSPTNVHDDHLKQCSVHAEMDALRDYTNNNFFNKDHLKRATIFVARINKAGSPVLAKPCRRCTKFLLDGGITKFIWTINELQCGISKVETMISATF